MRQDFAQIVRYGDRDKIRNGISTDIAEILGKKSPAFVMNDKGIAFDGVSMVPGAMVRGTIEGKDATEGFYEVKTSTIDAFVA